MVTVHGELIRSARAARRVTLPESAAKAIVASQGIAVPNGKLVTNLDGLRKAAATLTYPLVLKVVASEVVHKSDFGGVVAGIADQSALLAAWRRITGEPRLHGIKMDGMLVEECVPSGLELVVGARFDPSFGPTLMVGSGGIFLELLEDIVFRICPITDHDVHEMLAELRCYPRLRGARGTAPVSLAAVVATARRVSDLMMLLYDEVAELEINPLIVGSDSAIAADVRMVLKPVTR